MTHGNKVVTTYSYDAASQLLSLVHQLGATNINSFTYTYDRVGNRKTKVDRNGSSSYTYDVLNRLVEAINPLPSNPLETYNYDPVGNRLTSNQNGASAFNQANQLLEDASFTYQYDANGNLTRKTAKVGGALTSYEYDAENKLARVVSNGTVADYRYDGLGRRVEKQVTQGPTTNVTRFIYDREDILLELDGSNNIVSRYTHGQGFDEPLILERSGVSFFYHVDGRGSITEITDSSGAVRQRYTYSSFGKTESELDPNFIQPYRFTSREFDSETGIYFYRARYYDPSTGRFLQEDPIGIFSGPNLYAYVGNNPISYSDPFGLCRDPGGPGIRYCIETFIPQASVWGFTGDNRGPQSNGGSYRTQQFVYQTPGGSTTSSSRPGTSQFCLFGYCVGREAERGPFWADVSDLPLGGRRIQVRGAASDGLFYGLAPDAYYNLTIVESGTCTVTAQVVGGQITPFPSIEVWQYGGPSGPQRVFYHNSFAAGTGPADLFRTVPVGK